RGFNMRLPFAYYLRVVPRALTQRPIERNESTDGAGRPFAVDWQSVEIHHTVSPWKTWLVPWMFRTVTSTVVPDWNTRPVRGPGRSMRLIVAMNEARLIGDPPTTS